MITVPDTAAHHYAVPRAAVRGTEVAGWLRRWNESWQGALKEGEVHLYYCSLDWGEAAHRYTAGWLSAEEKARADRLLDRASRESFSAGRAALRWLLGRYLQLPPQKVEIGYEKNGKPLVTGLHFNVSHSHQLALLAFSRMCPLGVDVEFIDPHLAYWQAAKIAFSAQEQAALSALADERQRQAFFDGWTLKEALLKALGSGMRVAPSDLTLRMDHGQPPELLSLSSENSEELQGCRLLRLTPGKDWAAALALRDAPREPDLRYAILT